MSDIEIVDGSYAQKQNAMEKTVRIRVESATDMERIQRSIEVLKSCNSEFVMRVSLLRRAMCGLLAFR